jgi:hypothetical protein
MYWEGPCEPHETSLSGGLPLRGRSLPGETGSGKKMNGGEGLGKGVRLKAHKISPEHPLGTGAAPVSFLTP